MNKIGIISDTHGLLRPEVLEKLQGCEMILHGGDINKQSILDELEKIAPVIAVRGNNDKEWAASIPEYFLGKIGDLRVFMVHNKKHIPKDLADADLVIYGHSHMYEDKKIGGIHYINPGSCGPRRFHQEISMALLHVEMNGSYTVEKIVIDHPNMKSMEDTIPADIGEKLPAIMKAISTGKNVEQITKKYSISKELSEQITRMYLTHPGIDKDGILRRIGL